MTRENCPHHDRQPHGARTSALLRTCHQLVRPTDLRKPLQPRQTLNARLICKPGAANGACAGKHLASPAGDERRMSHCQ